MLRLTLKGFFAHKLRFLLTGIAIALGISLLFGSVVFSATIKRTFDDMFVSVSDRLDADVRSKETTKTSDFEQHARINLGLIDQLRSLPSVDGVSVGVGGFAQIIDKQGNSMGSFGPPTLGISYPQDERLNTYDLVSGHAPGNGEVVLDKGSFDKGHFQLGDTVKILTRGAPETFALVGVAKFGAADSPAGATLAWFDLATAMRIVGEQGKVDDIALKAKDGVSREQLRDEVAAALPPEANLEVVTGDQIEKESQDSVAAAMSFVNSFLMVFALIALFVASFIIYNTFSIIVAQRTRELGLLRALGASRPQIVGSVAAEALALGVLASLVGLLGGVFLAVGLNALMAAVGFSIPTGALSIPYGTMFWCVLAGAVVTLIASLLPARRASRLAPIVAMRGGDGGVRAITTPRLATGVVFVVGGAIPLVVGLAAKPDNALLLVGVGAAAVFLGISAIAPVFSRPVSRLLGSPFAWMGEPGHLGQENAMRNPRRTASTASALMVGVALVGMISILATSAKLSTDAVIDQASRADFVVAAKGSGFGTGGFSPDIRPKIASLPEVEVASPVRLASATVSGEAGILQAIDPQTLPAVLDLGKQEGSLADLGPGSIAVAEKSAAEHGWRLGQTISVDYSSTAHEDARIVDVYERRELVGNYLVPMATADQHFYDRLDMQLIVKLRDTVDPANGRAAIERVTSTYESLEVLDQTQYKAQQQASVDQLLALIYALLFLAVIIAVLGIANTLVLSIHERSRELGLRPRAVGMTRGQVRRAIGTESIIIALLGAVLGLAIGCTFGVAVVEALRDEGITHLAIPVGQMITITVLAALAGIVASIAPAQRASRVDILRAIATE